MGFCAVDQTCGNIEMGPDEKRSRKKDDTLTAIVDHLALKEKIKSTSKLTLENQAITAESAAEDRLTFEQVRACTADGKRQRFPSQITKSVDNESNSRLRAPYSGLRRISTNLKHSTSTTCFNLCLSQSALASAGPRGTDRLADCLAS